ncbi:MAG: UDP-3-O-(3-hydroxymyristoyl)glucosamine N-acyltransferase [Deltaproteobacteria bacterium]|nr:MAG: UDP-3-O-(3-hydroxymyristoyl)glucosamine N-acyltransferase [Deltaproteobacteria bacterium]
MEYSLQELADRFGGEVHGDAGVRIRTLNGFDYARKGEITFLNKIRNQEQLEQCRASACIVPEGVTSRFLPLLQVPQVDLVAARIHNFLLAREFQAAGVHPSAVVEKDCIIPEDVSIGAQVYIGAGVKLGHRVSIGHGAVIEDDVVVGDDTCIHARVVVAHGCRIGSRVTLFHGAVIGSDGFGFATDENGNHVSKPQVGTVRIDDDVKIGACTCVDRAAFGMTWIKAGTRIDNLVQVAHNVVVGENSILVAHTGIAGSAVLGRNVVLGGMTAVKGHITLGDGVMAAAMSGIHNSQPAGAILGGIPACDIKKWKKNCGAVSRTPEMVKEVRRLRKEVDRLTELLNNNESNHERNQGHQYADRH